MKYIISCILFLALGTGCKPKELTGDKLKAKLVETMDDYLHKTLKPGVVITIKDVIYYTDKEDKSYLCEFPVNMHFNNSDTTGTVAATISNDFKTVKRTQ